MLHLVYELATGLFCRATCLMLVIGASLAQPVLAQSRVAGGMRFTLRPSMDFAGVTECRASSE